MSQPLYTSMSGINAATTELEVISNNVANINTTAFKSSSVNFSDVYSRTISYGNVASGGIGGTNPIQIGVGTQVSSISKNFTTGSSVSTGKSTDLMIEGPGFFTVQGGDGKTYYTRAGDFSFDDNGNLVTSDGYKVIGTDSILSTSTSIETVNIPTSIIAIVEGNKNIGATSISKLNNISNPITTGTFTITVSDGTNSVNVPITLADLSGDMNGLANTIQTGLNKVVTVGADTYTIAGGVVALANGKMLFNISGATLQKNANPAVPVSGLTFGGLEDTSNFVTQTEIASAKLTAGAYSTKILDYTCAITDVTSAANATTINSQTINTDGSIQATYAEGDTLSVQLDDTGEKYEFVYTTKAGVGIYGDKLAVSPQVAVPANFIIQTATVTNTDGLLAVGSNLFENGPNAGTIMYTVAGQMGAGKIQSGYLEASNVDLSEELSSMILAQRAIEANSRVFSAASDVMHTIVQMGR